MEDDRVLFTDEQIERFITAVSPPRDPSWGLRKELNLAQKELGRPLELVVRRTDGS
jgi:hypothetical protein